MCPRPHFPCVGSWNTLIHIRRYTSQSAGEACLASENIYTTQYIYIHTIILPYNSHVLAKKKEEEEVGYSYGAETEA